MRTSVCQRVCQRARASQPRLPVSLCTLTSPRLCVCCRARTSRARRKSFGAPLARTPAGGDGPTNAQIATMYQTALKLSTENVSGMRPYNLARGRT